MQGNSRMIFKNTAEWILDRSPYTKQPKTQARRLPIDGQVAVFEPGRSPLSYLAKAVNCLDKFDNGRLVYSVYHNNRSVYRAFLNYAIQNGHGKAAIGRFVLKAITYDYDVGDLSEADCIAEGFADREHFMEIWNKAYGRDAHKLGCWVLHIGRSWRL